MAESGLQKGFESPGVFWLPEEPDQRVSGQLSHTEEDGPQVSLIGGFGSSLARNFPIVHGILDDAPCTLFNCRGISSKASYGGLQQAVLEADLLLVGEHVASLDEPLFTGSKVGFGAMDEWVNFRAIIIESWQDEPVNSPSRFDLATQPRIISKIEAISGTLTLLGYYSGRFGHRQIDWNHHSFFELSLEKPASIRAVSQVIFELQNLFALLTWTRASISLFSVLRPVAKDAMNSSGKRWSGLYGHWDMSPLGGKTSSNLLIRLEDVFQELPQIISSWFRSSPAIKTANNVFAGIVRSEGQYLQFEFIALMQTVEATHRSLDAKSYMPEAEYEKVRQILIAAIPDNVEASHRTALRSRIEYGNELSLRTRLRELLLRLPEKVRRHICDNHTSFVGQAVDLRNMLTHPKTDGTAIEPDPTRIWETSQRIQLLLTIIFLNELGFPFDKIEKTADNNMWYSFL